MSAGHAVAVIINTQDGIVLIRDMEKPTPQFWKFPGGRDCSVGANSAVETAISQLIEKLGLLMYKEDLTILLEQTRRNHLFTLFYASLVSKLDIAHKKEQLEVHFFSPQEILREKLFFPPHKEAAGKHLAAL